MPANCNPQFVGMNAPPTMPAIEPACQISQFMTQTPNSHASRCANAPSFSRRFMNRTNEKSPLIYPSSDRRRALYCVSQRRVAAP